jgi:cytochrome c peroxidase
MRTTLAMALGLTLALAAAPGCKKDESTGKEPADKTDPSAGKTADTGGKATGTGTGAQPEPGKVELPAAPQLPPLPAGLPETPSPETNPTTPEKVELGAMLFFDKRLSDGGQHSCESCHVPEQGWADGQPLSKKASGEMNTRHTPTLFNVGYLQDFYWDGRKKTLEDQILAAWTGQMGATPAKIADKLDAIPAYKARFERAFAGEPASDKTIPMALAAFVRTIRIGDSAWDRFEGGDAAAATDELKAGFKVFTEKAQCALCHAPPYYMDTLHHNVGIGYENVEKPDVGRFEVTKDAKDTGAFKTPGMRGAALHPPFFHDGSSTTLEAAVDTMLAGGHRKGNKHIDPKLKPAKLTKPERDQLIAFLKALSPEQKPFERPVLP